MPSFAKMLNKEINKLYTNEWKAFLSIPEGNSNVGFYLITCSKQTSRKFVAFPHIFLSFNVNC